MWIKLENEKEFNDLIHQSEELDQQLLIFKHSSRCGFSSMIKRRFESEYDSNLTVYEVDVIKSRELSNYISSTYSIQHESPQIILFKSGQPVFSDSHSGVNVENIKSHLTV
tara:strand:+ start:30 stop:362 length:333 start_codon:yes stop_codon:yes gene_type:complete